MTVFSAAFLLFLVLDPFGNIPFFLTALRGVDPDRQHRSLARDQAGTIGGCTLSQFAWLWLA